MSQDIISDALNQIRNMKKSGKTNIIIKRHSQLLRNILDMAKESGYLDYFVDGKELNVEIKNLNEIRAIKPRYTVDVKKINYYIRRFLPAKNFGFIIVSTNKGLLRHYDAEEQNLGGCLIAYMF